MQCMPYHWAKRVWQVYIIIYRGRAVWVGVTVTGLGDVGRLDLSGIWKISIGKEAGNRKGKKGALHALVFNNIKKGSKASRYCARWHFTHKPLFLW